MKILNSDYVSNHKRKIVEGRKYVYHYASRCGDNYSFDGCPSILVQKRTKDEYKKRKKMEDLIEESAGK